MVEELFCLYIRKLLSEFRKGLLSSWYHVLENGKYSAFTENGMVHYRFKNSLTIHSCLNIKQVNKWSVLPSRSEYFWLVITIVSINVSFFFFFSFSPTPCPLSFKFRINQILNQFINCQLYMKQFATSLQILVNYVVNVFCFLMFED